MNKNTLLKDIELNIFPDCPRELVHLDGSMGMICDRAGLKYIVAPPLVESCEYLYDLNIRTVSAGANAINEIGIWIEYQSLSEKNKAIADNLINSKRVIVCTHTDAGRLTKGDFRISIDVDFEKETIETANLKLLEKIKSLGFELQDVLFGKYLIEEAVNEKIERTMDRTMRWNGNEFVTNPRPTLTKKEALATLIEEGWVLDEEYLWISKELFDKHNDYIGSHKTEDGLNIPQ